MFEFKARKYLNLKTKAHCQIEVAKLLYDYYNLVLRT